MNITTSRGLAAAGLLATALAGASSPRPPPRPPRPSGRPSAASSSSARATRTASRSGRASTRTSATATPSRSSSATPTTATATRSNTDEKFLVDGVVKASVKVDGKKAVIKGTAVRYGARSKVYEEYDDAGFLIKTRGFHRQLRTDLVATLRRQGRPADLRPRLLLRPRGQEDPDHLSAAGRDRPVRIGRGTLGGTTQTHRTRESRVAAGDLDVGVVGHPGVDERRALEVADRAVVATVDVEGLAAVVALDADDPVAAQLEDVGVVAGRRARAGAAGRGASAARGRCCPRTTGPARRRAARVRGRSAATARPASGASSPSSIRGHPLGAEPGRWRWSAATQPSRVARSTNRLARKPGIEPVCPRRRPTVDLEQPQPQPVAVGRRLRRGHLVQGVAGRARRGARWPGSRPSAARSVDRAPRLPGRRHRAGVLVRLVGERLR